MKSQSQRSMKKSVEDIIYGINEASSNLSLSNLNVLQSSTILSKHNSVASLYSGTFKSDITAEQDSISKSSDTSGDTTDKPKNISKLSQRVKKKSWYSAIYPCYKSRSDDFKKLFKEVPSDERLVVDYSCAVQRDILVHGRLYATQNYICFYANIFGWETIFSIKWKDVQSITKEKTAIVIPNAILICTDKDRHFFTSFATRDKAFLILFRIWQNVLMEKQLSPQELWQFVHSSYGDELGLTSDDDDYIDPNDPSCEFDKLLNFESQREGDDNISADSISDFQIKMKDNKNMEKSGGDDGADSLFISEDKQVKRKLSKASRQREDFSINKDNEQIPTDMSDSSSDSDENNVPFISTAECTSPHEGRQLVHTILPINVDMLFNLLFSKSKFLLDFHHTKKTTDLNFGDWITNDDGIKQRTVNLTVALAQSVGPKTSKVTETQTLRECSKPGELYSIDVDSVNAGIPYADSFMVIMHYCLVRTVDDHTMLSIHANIKYKKSIWGMVKGFIEKNTWNGLDEFYSSLLRSLQSETCVPPAKGKGRRPRRG
ncbi:GRAMD1B family protein [Megaselia abdita]